MIQRYSCYPVLMLILIAALMAASCATGPAAPEKGTPAFYWQAAKENYVAGDYVQTADHLEQIARKKSEFTERALPWRLVLLAGLTRGYMDVAQQFELGSRANKQSPAPLRKAMLDHRSFASRYSLLFAESFEEFEKTNPPEELTLAFTAPPKGTLNPIMPLGQAAQGRMISETDLANAQLADLQKSVVFIATRAVGAEGDTAKTREMLKDSAAKTPKKTFYLAMAMSLYEQSELHGPAKLDMPDRQKFFLEHASDALKGMEDSKVVKELKAKIDKALKAMPKRS